MTEPRYKMGQYVKWAHGDGIIKRMKYREKDFAWHYAIGDPPHWVHEDLVSLPPEISLEKFQDHAQD